MYLIDVMVLSYFSQTQSKTQAFIGHFSEEGDESGQVWSTSQTVKNTLLCHYPHLDTMQYDALFLSETKAQGP